MTGWFATARFGMFVHWSHSSQQGIELSWPLVGGLSGISHSPQDVPVEQYHSTAATFDPTAFDAPALAALARRAGMQYAVLTAKHHDGFAMFHTAHSDFSVANAPCRRDLVREFVDAMRHAGLRVGLYFSLIDWHHPDYPAFTDADKPYRFGRHRQPSADQWERYLAFMFGQVRELLSNYGTIDLFWFDGGWERTPEQWRAGELMAMIRSLQPGIIVNDRLPGHGDFATPEQFVPAQPPPGPWETCMTMNESWGYNPSDRAYKSARQIIHTLCEVAGRGGNLLLNVSPRGDGSLPPEQGERLEAVAAWMAANGESITGTVPGLEPWQFYGPSTRRGNTVYLHALMRPYDAITVRGIPIKRIARVRHVATGEPLSFTIRGSVVDLLARTPDPLGEAAIALPARLLDDAATVVAIEFAGQPVSR